jgi:hypothetical protein
VRIAPSQPSEAMARIVSRKIVPFHSTLPFHSTKVCRLFISVSAFNFRVRRIGREKRQDATQPPRRQIAQFFVQRRSNSADPFL